MDGKPLSILDEKVVFHWLKMRNEPRVAEKLRISTRQVKAILDRIEVQDEIERQENVLIQERMKLQANAENLGNDLLDKELLGLILLDPMAAAPSAEAKRKAIELGYILTGRIESGNTRSLEAKEGPDAKPNFYQAFVQVGGTVNVSPILPDAAKDQPLPDAMRQKIRELTTPAEPVQGTAHAKPPQSGKVRLF
jgi:hypothetical protein